MVAPPPHRGDDRSSADLTWGVGAVSSRLGIASSTLRTWERRYAIGPSHRTTGGHRRYTANDIERVDVMRRLLERGVSPREAARSAHELDAVELTSLTAGELPGDADMDTAAFVTAVVKATRLVDPNRLSGLFGGAMRRLGVLEAWTTRLAPALIAIGEAWSAGTVEIVGEHVASERLMAELRLHARGFGPPSGRSAVVLASAEDDQHSLPVYALEAALAEQGLGSLVLGARVPWHSLADLAGRMLPDVIFVWATLERPGDDTLADVIDQIPDGTRVLAGGPGWTALPSPRVHRVADLAEAVRTIAEVGAERGDRPHPDR